MAGEPIVPPDPAWPHRTLADARAALRRGERPAESEPKVVPPAIPRFHVTACPATLMIAIATGGTSVLMRRWGTAQATALIPLRAWAA